MGTTIGDFVKMEISCTGLVVVKFLSRLSDSSINFYMFIFSVFRFHRHLVKADNMHRETLKLQLRALWIDFICKQNDHILDTERCLKMLKIGQFVGTLNYFETYLSTYIILYTSSFPDAEENDIMKTSDIFCG